MKKKNVTNLEMIASNSGRANGREGFRLLGGPGSKPVAPGRQHLNPTMLKVSVARTGAIPS